jgi:Right handed beta helix region
MKRLYYFLFFSLICAGQAFRVDPVPVFTTSGSTPAGAYAPVLAVPGSTIKLYTDQGMTSLATTFTDITAGTPCPTSAQVVLAGAIGSGVGNCRATTDAQGAFGFNAMPGNYWYTIRLPNGATYGPFAITAQFSAPQFVQLPYTGGVAELQTTRLNRIVDAKGFGAVGNGIADDAQSLQFGLNAAVGGVLRVTPGTYLIGSSLTMASNTSLWCDGGATLKLKNATNAAIVKNSDRVGGNVGLNMKGCTFDTNTAGQSGTFLTLDFYKISGSSFENVVVLGGNIPNDGYSGAFTCYLCTSTVFRNVQAGNGAVGGGGLTLEMGSDNLIDGGVFSNSQDSGIVVDCSPNTKISNVTASNNWGSDISFNSQYGQISNVRTDNSKDQSGVTVGHSGFCNDGLTIADGSYTHVDGVTALGNHTAGMLVQGSSTHGVVLTNIEAHNNGTAFAGGAGVLTADSAWNVSVTNAHVSGNQWGVFSGYSKQNSFVNIHAWNNLQDGIRLLHTTDTSITDSVIFDNGQAAGANAFGITLSGADSINCIVNNNRVYSSTTQLRALYIDPLDTVFMGNILEGPVTAVTSGTYGNDITDLRRVNSSAITLPLGGTLNFPTDGTAPNDFKIIASTTPTPTLYIGSRDLTSRGILFANGAISPIGTNFFTGGPGGSMPAFARYDVAAASGNWTVTGQAPIARAAASSQNIPIVLLPLGYFVQAISAKTSVACTGTAVATINAFGDATSASAFKGSVGYDLEAAVSNTNQVNPQITVGGGTFAPSSLTVTVGAGAQNVSLINDGCAFTVWVMWAKRP